VSIVVLPVLFEGQTKAVIELAALKPFSETDLAFLDQLMSSIGVVFNTIEATMRTEGLLTQSQQLTAELQSRQSELQVRNEELGTKARLLADQNAEVERKNAEVEQARYALEEKAEELALTSKYKSEFLANMSHELRTPLNSILILSQQLAANSSGALSEREVEFSRNIHASGSDLLHLINDILDLSKIESGTATVDIEEIAFSGLRDSINRSFRHVAESKKLPFHVHFADDLPHSIHSDPKRLQQILKNLLSNAVKFTTNGHVTVRAGLASKGWSADHPVLSKAEHVAAFSVEDTGIGIASDKQKLIFEAFQQADAGTSRKFGGTGLGLAISKELAQLLGGEIVLTSVPAEGSTFTLFLPLQYIAPEDLVDASDNPNGTITDARQLMGAPRLRAEPLEDDRDDIATGEAVLLIVEDDRHYAQILLDMARARGFKGVVASSGGAGLALARQIHPTAISLDITLPDMLGWTVLHQLKVDPATRHVPVQIVALDDERQHALAQGAISYVVKGPTTDGLEAGFDRIAHFLATRTKRLLIVQRKDDDGNSIAALLEGDDIEVVEVGTVSEGLDVLRHNAIDCIVIDSQLPDRKAFKLIETIQRNFDCSDLPIVVFSAEMLAAEEQEMIRAAARNDVVKHALSSERLLDETCLFLHRAMSDLSHDKQAMLKRLHNSNAVLKSRKVLVVDDDARNIFALASLLENYEMEVLNSTSGHGAIEIIQSTPDISIVLMDIMMPDMDGYETMRRIRATSERRTLPILALTAKAMKGDREKCLDAGASDYISKPVHSEQLLALMRVWLFRQG
jgi:signal transduction histidine kinase/CheY-like chemotaxis protein